jgi:hypothetical protein
VGWSWEADTCHALPVWSGKLDVVSWPENKRKTDYVYTPRQERILQIIWWRGPSSTHYLLPLCYCHYSIMELEIMDFQFPLPSHAVSKSTILFLFFFPSSSFCGAVFHEIWASRGCHTLTCSNNCCFNNLNHLFRFSFECMLSSFRILLAIAIDYQFVFVWIV